MFWQQQILPLYVHRIGRTGRAGASGEAISLVSADETTYLHDIEKLIGEKIEVSIVEGFEPDPNASTQPIKRGQGRQQRSKPKDENQQQSKRNNTSNSGRNRNRNRRRKR